MNIWNSQPPRLQRSTVLGAAMVTVLVLANVLVLQWRSQPAPTTTTATPLPTSTPPAPELIIAVTDFDEVSEGQCEQDNGLRTAILASLQQAAEQLPNARLLQIPAVIDTQAPDYEDQIQQIIVDHQASLVIYGSCAARGITLKYELASPGGNESIDSLSLLRAVAEGVESILLYDEPAAYLTDYVNCQLALQYDLSEAIPFCTAAFDYLYPEHELKKTDEIYATALIRGYAYATQQSYEQAITDYTEAIWLDSTRAVAYYYRGRAYAAARMYDEAEADQDRAIDRDLGFVQTYFAGISTSIRGHSHVLRGEFEQALAAYNLSIELDPASAYAFRERAGVHEIMGMGTEAALDYERAIELDPEDARTYYSRGVFHYFHENYEAAIADYTRVIELEPEDEYLYAAYAARGITYDIQDRHDLALADYNQVLGIEPADPLSYLARGMAYAGHGMHHQAIIDFTRAIEISPDYAAAYHNRGLSYEAQGAFTQAQADFARAAELDPSMAD